MVRELGAVEAEAAERRSSAVSGAMKSGRGGNEDGRFGSGATGLDGAAVKMKFGDDGNESGEGRFETGC